MMSRSKMKGRRPSGKAGVGAPLPSAERLSATRSTAVRGRPTQHNFESISSDRAERVERVHWRHLVDEARLWTQGVRGTELVWPAAPPRHRTHEGATPSTVPPDGAAMRRMRHKVQDLMNVNKYVRDARADDVTTRRYERESVAGDLESESSSLSLVQAKAKFQLGYTRYERLQSSYIDWRRILQAEGVEVKARLKYVVWGLLAVRRYFRMGEANAKLHGYAKHADEVMEAMRKPPSMRAVDDQCAVEELLLSLSFFQRLPLKAVKELCLHVTLRVCVTGEALFDLGDVVKDVLVIMSGRACMDKRVAVSELDDTILTPMVVKEVLPGEALGHEHLSQNKVLHGLGARTKTMTELIVIPLPVYKRMVLPLQRERELEKASYLRAVSLLQGLEKVSMGEELLHELVSTSSQRAVHMDQVLLQQGDKLESHNFFYVVTQGVVSVVRTMPSATGAPIPLEIDQLVAASYFPRQHWQEGAGDGASGGGEAKPSGAVASLVTRTDTTYLVVNKWDMLAILKEIERTTPKRPIAKLLAQLDNYTQNTELLSEYEEGKDWERFKSNLRSGVFQTKAKHSPNLVRSNMQEASRWTNEARSKKRVEFLDQGNTALVHLQPDEEDYYEPLSAEPSMLPSGGGANIVNLPTREDSHVSFFDGEDSFSYEGIQAGAGLMLDRRPYPGAASVEMRPESKHDGPSNGPKPRSARHRSARSGRRQQPHAHAEEQIASQVVAANRYGLRASSQAGGRHAHKLPPFPERRFDTRQSPPNGYYSAQGSAGLLDAATMVTAGSCILTRRYDQHGRLVQRRAPHRLPERAHSENQAGAATRTQLDPPQRRHASEGVSVTSVIMGEGRAGPCTRGAVDTTRRRHPDLAPTRSLPTLPASYIPHDHIYAPVSFSPTTFSRYPSASPLPHHAHPGDGAAFHALRNSPSPLPRGQQLSELEMTLSPEPSRTFLSPFPCEPALSLSPEVSRSSLAGVRIGHSPSPEPARGSPSPLGGSRIISKSVTLNLSASGRLGPPAIPE